MAVEVTVVSLDIWEGDEDLVLKVELSLRVLTESDVSFIDEETSTPAVSDDNVT